MFLIDKKISVDKPLTLRSITKYGNVLLQFTTARLITNYDNVLLQFTIAWLLQFSITVITIYDVITTIHDRTRLAQLEERRSAERKVVSSNPDRAINQGL